MKRIYMAMATWNYEGSTPIRAFATKGAAEGFVLRCIEHHKKRPECPNVIADTPENDAAFDAFALKAAAWERRHPAKEHASCDGFTIRPLKLFD